MLVKFVTMDHMIEALQVVNKMYDNNITFKRLESVERKRRIDDIRFTLTVKDSKESGARRSIEDRKISAACWHAHGDFFDALLDINDNAVIEIGDGSKVSSQGGNWVDKNIGSEYYPFYFSEACNC